MGYLHGLTQNESRREYETEAEQAPSVAITKGEAMLYDHLVSKTTKQDSPPVLQLEHRHDSGY